MRSVGAFQVLGDEEGAQVEHHGKPQVRPYQATTAAPDGSAVLHGREGLAQGRPPCHWLLAPLPSMAQRHTHPGGGGVARRSSRNASRRVAARGGEEERTEHRLRRREGERERGREGRLGFTQSTDGAKNGRNGDMDGRLSRPCSSR